jgi:hypothetical protein
MYFTNLMIDTFYTQMISFHFKHSRILDIQFNSFQFIHAKIQKVYEICMLKYNIIQSKRLEDVVQLVAKITGKDNFPNVNLV